MDPYTGSIPSGTAIVTGGGSGINYAFTKMLLSAGYNVLVADICLRPKARDGLIQAEQSCRGRAVFIETDVTDWLQLERTFDECKTQFGHAPDLVVPGAGVYEPSSNSYWQDTDTDNRYKVLDINLVHPIKMTRLAIRHMLAERGNKGHDVTGTIVHVSSIAGQRSSLITPLYQASKHGINSFVRGMAPLEAAIGIRVVAVAPGTVETPLFTDHPEAARFLDLQHDFMLPADEVARAMMALVIERGKYKGGTVLEVCDVGGRWRQVSLLNDPGPQGPASKTSRKQDAAQEVWELLGVDGHLREGQSLTKTDQDCHGACLACSLGLYSSYLASISTRAAK